MHFIDTHCHVDLFPDYQAIVAKTEREQIYTIAVTNTPSVFRQSSRLTSGKKYLRTALGLHPELAAERFNELGQLIDMLDETRYIGEVGLDFTTNSLEERKRQEKVFAAVLEHCANYGDKIFTIHSRRAAGRVVEMVGSSYPGKMILHWFSGSVKELEGAVSCGFYFSVNSSMISTGKGRELIAAIPVDRVLTESDGPFAQVNGKSISPPDMALTVRKLADLYSCSPSDMKDKIYQNFRGILTGKARAITK